MPIARPAQNMQRAVFQLVLFVAFVVITISQGVAGSITKYTLVFYGLGVPFMVAGLWSGFSAGSTMRHSARAYCGFCCLPDYR
jgi:hypothetical protein